MLRSSKWIVGSALALGIVFSGNIAAIAADDTAKPAEKAEKAAEKADQAETVEVVVPKEGMGINELACQCDSTLNQLFVRALNRWRRAESATIWRERWRLYGLARLDFEEIIKKYPRSWVAVRLLANERIGNFRYYQLHRAYRLSTVEVCNSDDAPKNCGTLLRDHVRVMVTELQSVTSKVTRLEELLARMEANFSGSLDEFRRMSVELGSLRAQMNQLEIEKSDYENTIAGLTAERDKFRNNVRNVARKLRATQQEKETLEAVLVENRARIADLERLLKDAQGKGGGADPVAFGKLQAELAAASGTNARLQKELDRLKSRFTDIKDRSDVRVIQVRRDFLDDVTKLGGLTDEDEIVNERIIFSSEVLFDVGKDTLRESGIKRLASFAKAVQDATDKIPGDIEWALQIDGHTDNRPIRTARFPSNWELSSARALSVVRFLASQGIPESRLIAAGHSQFAPRDDGNTEAAFQRNRRVEVRMMTR